MELECGVLESSEAMVPEMNLKALAQINWWNQLLISLAQFSRWLVESGP
jgi:hypothetical protein